MSNNKPVETLLFVRFDRGSATYSSDFEVKIEGVLWPRELAALSSIVRIYKEQSRTLAMDKKAKS